jgi:hypothetical protein
VIERLITERGPPAVRDRRESGSGPRESVSGPAGRTAGERLGLVAFTRPEGWPKKVVPLVAMACADVIVLAADRSVGCILPSGERECKRFFDFLVGARPSLPDRSRLNCAGDISSITHALSKVAGGKVGCLPPSARKISRLGRRARLSFLPYATGFARFASRLGPTGQRAGGAAASTELSTLVSSRGRRQGLDGTLRCVHPRRLIATPRRKCRRIVRSG